MPALFILYLRKYKQKLFMLSDFLPQSTVISVRTNHYTFTSVCFP